MYYFSIFIPSYVPIVDNLLDLSFIFNFLGEPNPDALKTKKSELRLYCDLLMQQVHLVKTSANSKDGPEIEVECAVLYTVAEV